MDEFVPVFFSLVPGANIPVRATVGSAGMDLCAFESATLKPNGPPVLVRTGVRVAIPGGHVGMLSLRSGFAYKSGAILLNGVGIIDSDYRGEIMAAMFNVSPIEITIEAGERFAQLTILPIPSIGVFYADDLDLDETSRGEGGFGSTG
jgi:dUTP pyrophosphatase